MFPKTFERPEVTASLKLSRDVCGIKLETDVSLIQLVASLAVKPSLDVGVYEVSVKVVPDSLADTDPVAGLLVRMKVVKLPALCEYNSDVVERSSPDVTANRTVDLMPPGVVQTIEVSLFQNVDSSDVTASLTDTV